MSEEIQEKSIKIKVVPCDETYTSLIFQVKYSTTKMNKIMDAFAKKQNIDVKTFRFCFDGKRISGDETPKLLEMDDGDAIEVYLEQLAGQLL